MTFKKSRTRRMICRFCSSEFFAADVKARICDQCRLPRACRCGCGTLIKQPGSFWTAQHHPSVCSPEAHAKQGIAIRGDRNPSKRPDVRKKISLAVRDHHPSKIHPEIWEILAYRMRRSRWKVSKLEQRIRLILPARFKHRFFVDHYEIDFADPENKIALEVHGCWYHGCQQCQRSITSLIQKQSIENDADKADYLIQRGWSVVIVWEHEVDHDFSYESIRFPCRTSTAQS